MANLKQILSNSANKVTRRAKKIAQGINNAISDARAAIARAARAKEVLEEIAIIEAITLPTTKLEYQTELNKLSNKLNTSSLGEYSLEDYFLDVTATDKFYNTAIYNLEQKVIELKDEYKSLTENNFGLKKTEAEKLARLKADEVAEKQNNAKNKLIRIPKSFNDIVNTLNTILSILFQFISINNAKITRTVDSVNDFISSASTKEDIEKAKLLRNQAIVLINTNKQSIQNVNKIINIIQLISQILNPLLTVLFILPPLAITGATIRVIQRLQKILNDSLALLDTANLIINKLIDDLNFQESRLLRVNDILDINTENLSQADLSTLINNLRSGLGYLKGYDYKGFRFFIKEEEDPKFIVKGNKRRFAVAVNKDGNEVLKSQASFTLEPDILVEELKLIIDEKNLVV